MARTASSTKDKMLPKFPAPDTWASWNGMPVAPALGHVDRTTVYKTGMAHHQNGCHGHIDTAIATFYWLGEVTRAFDATIPPCTAEEAFEWALEAAAAGVPESVVKWKRMRLPHLEVVDRVWA